MALSRSHRERSDDVGYRVSLGRPHFEDDPKPPAIQRAALICKPTGTDPVHLALTDQSFVDFP